MGGAVRLRTWNGDLSLLRGTHHDPDLSRPEVRPEQRCCHQQQASGSRVPWPQSGSVSSILMQLNRPASAGLFLCFQPTVKTNKKTNNKKRKKKTNNPINNVEGKTQPNKNKKNKKKKK